MNLTRSTIIEERFALARAGRGYDPEEVDRHLRRIADSWEATLGNTSQQQTVSDAHDRLREIMGSAERTASALREAAESEAAEIVRNASETAGTYTGRAEAAGRSLLGRVGILDQEIEARIAQIRRAGEEAAESFRAAAVAAAGPLQAEAAAVAAELELVRDGLAAGLSKRPRADEALSSLPPSTEADRPEPGTTLPPENLHEVEEMFERLQAGEAEPAETRLAVSSNGQPKAGTGTACANGAVAVTERDAVERPATGQDADEEAMGQDASASQPGASEESTGHAAPPPSASVGADGPQRARLAALNMALSGAPRAETARHLSENFRVKDVEALLDEVYDLSQGNAE